MKKFVFFVVFVIGMITATQAQSLLEISNSTLFTEHAKGSQQLESDYGTIPVKFYVKHGMVYMVKVTCLQQSELSRLIEQRHDYQEKRLGSMFVDYWYTEKKPLSYLQTPEVDTVISIRTGKKYVIVNGRAVKL